MTQPIYNDPNHPEYGPCRRLHLILLYLHGDDLPTLEQRYDMVYMEDWTISRGDIEKKFGGEGFAASRIIERIEKMRNVTYAQ